MYFSVWTCFVCKRVHNNRQYIYTCSVTKHEWWFHLFLFFYISMELIIQKSILNSSALCKSG
jgi:hypothetical protein